MSETERVTLVGNLTADPELRFTPSGLQVANLRLAVTPASAKATSGRTGRRPSTPSTSGATKPSTPPTP